MIKVFLTVWSRLFIIIFLLYANTAFGAVYHGLIYVEDYYSNDSSSAYDFNFLTTRFRLDATKLNEAGTLSFHFDGRERNNLGSHDYSRSIKNEKMDTLNLEYTGINHLYLAAGRLWPKELPAEKIDGANILIQEMDLGIGLFGGAKPDPYTGEFNTDFTSVGGYLFYRKEGLSANLAFVYNGYKGHIDREYLYGQYSYSPWNALRLYGTITADINQITDNIGLTNALLEVSYRPDYKKGLTLGYNQFRAIRLYQSMSFDIVDSRQESYYLRGDYRFYDRYIVYGRYEHQTLHYQTLETKLADSNTYQIGIRNDNLMNLNINLDVSTTRVDGYSSSYDTYNVQASRYITEALQLVLNTSYMQSTYDLLDYTDTILTYEVAGYWTLNKKWSLSASYEGRQARDYTTNTVLSRISYRF